MGIERPLLLDLPEEWRGGRVIVRPFRDTDAQPLFDAIQESADHLAMWLAWARSHKTVDDTREFIRRQAARFLAREGFVGLGIFRSADGAVLGGIGMQIRDWSLPAFEIGYWLRHSAEGHGYVSEAVRLLTTYAFTALHAERLAIRCDARNERSKRVPERLGFVFEGRIRHDAIGTDGTIRDTLVYAMIPEEFVRARAKWAGG